MTEQLIHIWQMRLLLDVQRCTEQSLKEVLCDVERQVGLHQGVWEGRVDFYQTLCVEGSGLPPASRRLQSDFFVFVCCHPERSQFEEPVDIRQMVKPCLLLFKGWSTLVVKSVFRYSLNHLLTWFIIQAIIRHYIR